VTGDVLVLRALGLGDAVTGIAPLRGVRRAWPDRRLWLAAPEAVGRWLQGLGLVDGVVPTTGLDEPLAWGRPGHVAVNLHGRGPQSHALLRATGPDRLVAFAAADHPDGPAWRADEHEVDRWCRLVRSAGGRCDRADLRVDVGTDGRSDEVLLHPGAASAARRWPPDRWAALARTLASDGARVTLTGGPDEQHVCERIADLAGPGVEVAGLLPSTSRSRAAKASGSPAWPNSGPENPPWWLGKTASSTPRASASAADVRHVSSPLLSIPAATTTRVDALVRAAMSGT